MVADSDGIAEPVSPMFQKELGLALESRTDALRKRLLESIEYLERKEYKVLSTEVPLEYLELWTLDIPDEDEPQDTLFLKILQGYEHPAQIPIALFVFDLVNQRRYHIAPMTEYIGFIEWEYLTVEFWTFCLVAKAAILKRNPDQTMLEFDIWDKSKCEDISDILVFPNLWKTK